MSVILLIIWFILIYYIVLHVIYLLLVIIGSTQLRRYNGGITFAEFRLIAQSPLSMPVTLIIPCHNESGFIVNTVRGALELNYPMHEVIVVNDGSADETVSVLAEAFKLRRVQKFGRKVITTKDIRGVYQSTEHTNLVLVDKVNGRRGDAINAAVTYSRYPLLCIIDADCYLEKDTLLNLARPLLRDSRTVAVTGVVRPSNGLAVANGEIVGHAFPKTLLGIYQEVEYARSFQWARIGLCRLRSMLCISGALLMIRKTLFEELKGSWADAITDDIEFTMRLNRHIHDRRKKDRQSIVFAPNAVCYTEVPEKFVQYASQRNRWQRGTLQAIFRNRGMLFNPRYGMTGLFGMPFFLIFEALAAIVEMTAWLMIPVTLLLGIATGREILIMIYLAYILGVFLSLAAVLLTESTRLRAASWRDFWRLILSILLDNLGFHQFHLITRVVGTVQYLFGRRDMGDSMERISTETNHT